MNGFTGSYKNNEVQFLVQKLPLDSNNMTNIEREKLIQVEGYHYSDLPPIEHKPSKYHISVYKEALNDSAQRIADEVMQLAMTIKRHAANKEHGIVLVSLIRAGVPLGCCLKEALMQLGMVAEHYAISIVKDRGLDEQAMQTLEQHHGKEELYFIDGWVGKSAVCNELTRSLQLRGGYPKQPQFVVLADPSGYAWLSASREDWLIPFGILGAPISGLLSRTIWKDDGYHGCIMYDALTNIDQSTAFLKTIYGFLCKPLSDDVLPLGISRESLLARRCCLLTMKAISTKFDVRSVNLIKPGIAEATRAVMRRAPELIIVKDKTDANLKLLFNLAYKASVRIVEDPDVTGPYKAVTIIKDIQAVANQ